MENQQIKELSLQEMECLQGGIYRPYECLSTQISYLSMISAGNLQMAAILEDSVMDCVEEGWLSWIDGV
jgi:hypothetical protein